MDAISLKHTQELYFCRRTSLYSYKKIVYCSVTELEGEKGAEPHFLIKEQTNDLPELHLKITQTDFEKKHADGQFFLTREEAEKKVKEQFEAWSAGINELTKEELIHLLFQAWRSDTGSSFDEIKVMKKKIHREFDILPAGEKK